MRNTPRTEISRTDIPRTDAEITLVNAVLPSSVRVPPQGILYLTSALEAAGIGVEIRDYQLYEGPAPWEAESFVDWLEGSADVVGLSCMSYALPLIITSARLFKQRWPHKKLVLGGIGPSGVAEDLLRYAPEIDVIVIGEGERTAVEVMGALRGDRPLESVRGIAFRANGSVARTPDRPRVPSLVELEAPAYGRVDLSRYRLVDIQFGRGCPYPCSFCDIAPYWDRKNTARPIEHFLDELETLVRVHGAKDVFIVDDTFVLSRPKVLQFCEGIRRRGLEVEWGCYARVDLMDEDLIRTMAAAGCRKVFYGVESGSDAVLESVRKELTVQDIADCISRSIDAFPFVTTSFIWGSPEESLSDLQGTALMLLHTVGLGACPQLNLVLPYSYSELYKTHRREIVFDPTHSSQLLFYRGNDREWLIEMIAERADLFSAFYRLPTPDFHEKLAFLADAGLDQERLQMAYESAAPI